VHALLQAQVQALWELKLLLLIVPRRWTRDPHHLRVIIIAIAKSSCISMSLFIWNDPRKKWVLSIHIYTSLSQRPPLRAGEVRT
jgi:hypothetical protein